MSARTRMQWHENVDPEDIAAWVQANGGEARVIHANTRGPGWPQFNADKPRIAVRNEQGWTYAKPGDQIVIGYSWFRLRYPLHGGGVHWEEVRDFRVAAA